ncbi:hypothetical protein ACIQZM_15070 [Peribacillus sp. NPDC097206]|uniref:hypothetical protein n=1 Tax=Peribacillus sp. NPDC097206 TaxID=3364398 RepID=UPI0037FFBB4D
MISASTWFNPYVLEVLILPIAFVIGTGSALVTKKCIVGPIIHVIISVLFYWWNFTYFHDEDYHYNRIDSEWILIDLIFVGITGLLSWGLLKVRRK